MAQHEERMKRALGALWHYPHATGNGRGRFEAEGQILELISLGAPLVGILDRLCIAIDVQIGDVTSLVSLADAAENNLCSITQRALEVGLDVFSSTGILSVDQTLLGTLEIYTCDPRRPTQDEHELIERVSHVAAIALQRHTDEQNLQKVSRRLRGRVVGAPETPPFVN
jgi:GAF domain-containing protein